MWLRQKGIVCSSIRPDPKGPTTIQESIDFPLQHGRDSAGGKLDGVRENLSGARRVWYVQRSRTKGSWVCGSHKARSPSVPREWVSRVSSAELWPTCEVIIRFAAWQHGQIIELEVYHCHQYTYRMIIFFWFSTMGEII